MNTTAITISDANGYLALYSDWLALSDSAKLRHIAKASAYAQTQWTCVAAVVWEGTPAIPDEIKEAIAYYAYADFYGKLFGSPSVDEERHGGLRSTMSKVGELIDEIQYFQGGAQTATGNKSSIGYPDALMRLYCEITGVGSISLIRV